VESRADSDFLKAPVWAGNQHCTVMLQRNENLASLTTRPVQLLLQFAGADRLEATGLQEAALQ
jgi:hypothetical protein